MSFYQGRCTTAWYKCLPLVREAGFKIHWTDQLTAELKSSRESVCHLLPKEKWDTPKRFHWNIWHRLILGAAPFRNGTICVHPTAARLCFRFNKDTSAHVPSDLEKMDNPVQSSLVWSKMLRRTVRWMLIIKPIPLLISHPQLIWPIQFDLNLCWK